MINELSSSLGRILPEYQLPADLLPGFLHPRYSVKFTSYPASWQSSRWSGQVYPGSLHQQPYPAEQAILQ